MTFAGRHHRRGRRPHPGPSSPRPLRPTAELTAPGAAHAGSDLRRAHRGRGAAGPAPESTGSPCCSTSGWATSAWTGPRPPCPPARRSGCASRRSCAPGCSGSSTCSTSPRPGCTPPTPSRCFAVLDALLPAAGNSLFVVEHDLDIVRRADWVVDLGQPGRGRGRRPGPVQRPGRRPGAGRRQPHTGDPFRGRGRGPAELPARAEPAGWHLRDVVRPQPRRARRRRTRSACSPRSPASPAPASRPWSPQVLAEGGAPSTSGAPVGEGAPGRRRPAPATPRRCPGGRMRPPSRAGSSSTELVPGRPAARSGAPRARNLATYTGLFDVVRRLFAGHRQRRGRQRATAPGASPSTAPRGAARPAPEEGFVAVELLFLPGTYAPCRPAAAPATTRRRSR